MGYMRLPRLFEVGGGLHGFHVVLRVLTTKTQLGNSLMAYGTLVVPDKRLRLTHQIDST